MLVAESKLERILRGRSDASIRFADLRLVLRQFGFKERIKGSHHIFFHDRLPEILNLQPRNSFAKPYQVKQVRDLLRKYKLEEKAEP